MVLQHSMLIFFKKTKKFNLNCDYRIYISI